MTAASSEVDDGETALGESAEVDGNGLGEGLNELSRVVVGGEAGGKVGSDCPEEHEVSMGMAGEGGMEGMHEGELRVEGGVGLDVVGRRQSGIAE